MIQHIKFVKQHSFLFNICINCGINDTKYLSITNKEKDIFYRKNVVLVQQRFTTRLIPWGYSVLRELLSPLDIE